MIRSKLLPAGCCLLPCRRVARRAPAAPAGPSRHPVRDARGRRAAAARSLHARTPAPRTARRLGSRRRLGERQQVRHAARAASSSVASPSRASTSAPPRKRRSPARSTRSRPRSVFCAPRPSSTAMTRAESRSRAPRPARTSRPSSARATAIASSKARWATTATSPPTVHAIVSYFAATNLTTILAQSTPFGLGIREPALKRLLGAAPKDAEPLARLASPVFQVDRSDPPLLLFHGDQDPQMPINQSHELEGAYERAGARSRLHRRARRGARRGRVLFARQRRARRDVPERAARSLISARGASA